MASQTPPRKQFLNYRIEEIPQEYSTAEKLKLCFHTDDKPKIYVRSIAPSISDPEEYTVTIEFRGSGEPRLDPERAECLQAIELDPDFEGFTPLNTPSEAVAAE
jgi:hypothetical protein